MRGDVVMTLGSDGAVKSASYYHAFGKHDDKLGGIETDKHRANTKVEDDDGLLNEGKRFRSLEYAIFLTPDPLEYQDGLNFYLYCGQNPWGRFDPLGLAEQQLRERRVNSILVGTIGGQSHSSRLIIFTAKEYAEIQQQNNYSKRIIKGLAENAKKDGTTHLNVGFFKTDDGKLRVNYNSESDDPSVTNFVTRIEPKDKESDPTGFNLAQKTLLALTEYEKNEDNIDYDPIRTKENQGNCNSAQNTLNEATDAEFSNKKAYNQQNTPGTPQRSPILHSIDEKMDTIHFNPEGESKNEKNIKL